MKMTLFLEIRTKLGIKEVTVKNKAWDSSQHYDTDAGELYRALQGLHRAPSTESSVFVSSGKQTKLHMTTLSKVTTYVEPTSSDWQKQLWKLVTLFLVGQTKAVVKLYPSPEFIFSCSDLLSFFGSAYMDPRGCPNRDQHSNSVSDLQQWGAWGQALETSASNDDILVKENMFSTPFCVCVSKVICQLRLCITVTEPSLAVSLGGRSCF